MGRETWNDASQDHFLIDYDIDDKASGSGSGFIRIKINGVPLFVVDKTGALVTGSASVAGAVRYKGVINCSANPNFPAATSGDLYVVSVAGKIGGASGVTMEAGDLALCKTTSAAGTQAAVGANWDEIQSNITAALADANNGLTNSSGTAKLGGTLLADTTIDIGAFGIKKTFSTVDATVTNTGSDWFNNSGTFDSGYLERNTTFRSEKANGDYTEVTVDFYTPNTGEPGAVVGYTVTEKVGTVTKVIYGGYNNSNAFMQYDYADSGTPANDSSAALMLVADPGDGALNMTGRTTTTRGTQSGLVALTSSAGALALDAKAGDYFTHTMTENTTLAVSNAPGAGLAQTIAIRILQHASAAKTLTLPASFKPMDGSDTAIQTGLGSYTILTATTFDGGTRWEYVMKAGG
jgi:hypothetical protein